MVWVCAIYFMASAVYVFTPTVASRCFGQKEFNAYFGIIYIFAVGRDAVC